jgi:hypothetical protein
MVVLYKMGGQAQFSELVLSVRGQIETSVIIKRRRLNDLYFIVE